ncbi:hypothetical protein WAE56_13365 [Iodobacter sp. LRB]|uniref:hypothetical protein n=1 Tax=Iodobacter sp. LRB TaxID=3127955 RepID=UPI00307F7A3C
MKAQSFSDTSIVTNKKVQINHAHFFCNRFPAYLLFMSILMAFSLGFIIGKEYFLPRMYEARIIIKPHSQPRILVAPDEVKLSTNGVEAFSPE